MAGGAEESKLGPATRLVTAGRRAEWTGTPAEPGAVVNPPVWRASTHLYPDSAALHAGKPNKDGHFYYGRRGAPTQWALADALTALEPGAAGTVLYPSGVAALAGIMNGIYYNEINFSMGLLLGAIGFSAAVIGGLGNIYGAILGGFIFAFLQTIGAVAMPFSSAYKDVFAFSVVIVLMAWKPTGLLAEKSSQRV